MTAAGKLYNASNGSIHYKRITPNGIYPLCNPGLLVGTTAGKMEVYYGNWVVSTMAANEVTCTTCKRIHAKEP